MRFDEWKAWFFWEELKGDQFLHFHLKALRSIVPPRNCQAKRNPEKKHGIHKNRTSSKGYICKNIYIYMYIQYITKWIQTYLYRLNYTFCIILNICIMIWTKPQWLWFLAVCWCAKSQEFHRQSDVDGDGQLGEGEFIACLRRVLLGGIKMVKITGYCCTW